MSVEETVRIARDYDMVVLHTSTRRSRRRPHGPGHQDAKPDMVIASSAAT